MEGNIFVVTELLGGSITDNSHELLAAGRVLADKTGAPLTAVLLGNNIDGLAPQLAAADEIILLSGPHLADFTPEAHATALLSLFDERVPAYVLCGATSMGLDLSALLSWRMNVPVVSSVRHVDFDDGSCMATSQQYGGKMLVTVKIQSRPAILSILPGAFRPLSVPEESRTNVVFLEGASAKSPRMQFRRMLEPEAGDVDITQYPVLVSVGRGIQNKDNIEVLEELAGKLGAVVSASRPVVDQGWLPMTRQVGRSGMIVKPKAYLAFGISGAPEHVEGMRDAELIIAVNTDKDAPIFSVAHYGVVADALDIAPALVDKLA